MDRRELTAYCGLYCGDCLRFRFKSADLARELASELKKVNFDQYAKIKSNFVKEFEHYNKAHKVLDKIVGLKCDTPCRLGGDGCEQGCEIKTCVESQELEGCWQCKEFETCDKFKFLEPYSGDNPRKNLRKIKKYGLEDWVKHREKFYKYL